jgi:hypothetical protein
MLAIFAQRVEIQGMYSVSIKGIADRMDIPLKEYIICKE